MPNPQANYCPGGGAGSMIYAGWCDGVPYQDGTFWHYIQYGLPLVGHPAGLLSPGMQCVVNNGAPVRPQHHRAVAVEQSHPPKPL